MRFKTAVLFVVLLLIIAGQAYSFSWPQLLPVLASRNPERIALEKLDGCWWFTYGGGRKFCLEKSTIRRVDVDSDSGFSPLVIFDTVWGDSCFAYQLENGSYRLDDRLNNEHYIFTPDDEYPFTGCAFLKDDPSTCKELIVLGGDDPIA